MVVVACNTSSAAALDTLKKEYPLPVIGVIEAGARAPASARQGDRRRYRDESHREQRLVCARDKKTHPDLNVVQQHATIFVSLTEEGWIDDEITRLTASATCRRCTTAASANLILGCTHFPCLKKPSPMSIPTWDLIDTGDRDRPRGTLDPEGKKLENREGRGDIELYASDLTVTIQRLKSVFFGDNGSEIKKTGIPG